MTKAAGIVLAALLAAAPLSAASAAEPPEYFCEAAQIDDGPACLPDEAVPPLSKPIDPLHQRLLKYAKLAVKHRMSGLASYYSSFFDGRKTANGEIYRNRRYSAAHLTLPLGTWVEVTSRATGKRIRLRVNDRGPYVNKFVLDLSRAAARYLGVDRTEDRYVDIRVIALPGEQPLPEDLQIPSIEDIEKAATAVAVAAAGSK